MRLKTIFGLAAVGTMFLSCQSDSYKITGFARAWHEGDTICLSTEAAPGGILAITTVSNGKFEFRGETTGTTLCVIYPKRAPEHRAEFFLEPDDITVELSAEVGRSRISGTHINNEWQLLTDSIELLGRSAISIIKTQATDSAMHRARYQAIDSLHRRMSDCIRHTAHRNRDNDLGRYITTHYEAPEFK